MTRRVPPITSARPTEQPLQAIGRAPWFVWWSALFLVGIVLRGLSHRLAVSPQLITFLSRAGWQLGGAGLVVTAGASLAALLWHRPLAKTVHRVNLRYLLVLLGLLVAFGCSEAMLRVVFRDGISFGMNRGPIARRFQRYYHFNRFHSRGPDAVGPKPAGVARILIQGDSITFGQGIKDRKELYPQLLLNELNRESPGRFEMAVAAIPGYEIGHHVAQLRAIGAEVAPDLIIYEWYENDLNVDKDHHLPRLPGAWETLFFHDALVDSSYAWFLVDDRLRAQLYARSPAARTYYQTTFAAGTPGWARFAEAFHLWAQEATAVSPRVLVLLYPQLPQREAVYPLRDIHERVKALCAESGLASMDFIEELDDIKFSGRTRVSRFDGHPSALMHARLAEVLDRAIRARWPELASGNRSASLTKESP